MPRRTVTIDPSLDQIINIVRGLFMLMGKEYNYTEVVNNAIFYGICYWLNIPKEKAIEMVSQVLTTDLKFEGIKDEEHSRILDILSKAKPLAEVRT